MIRPCLLAVLAALALPTSATAGDLLTGHAVDPRGRPVVCEGAVVVELDLVVSCDPDGLFSIPLPDERPAELTLVIHAPGFRDTQLQVSAPQTLSVTLRRGRSRRGQTTTFGGGWRSLERAPPTLDDGLAPGDATLTPADHALQGGGYSDVNRSLQALPGVTGDTAASAQIRIRGGEAHETLMFVDGIRLREPTHLGGLFGAFDPDLIERVTVSTGVPSATVPESLAGAVEAEYLDGPRDRVDGAIDLSFLAAAANLSVALDKDREQHPRASLVVGARRSLLQAYLGAFQAAGAVDIPLRTVDYGSYLARLVLEPTDRQRLRLSVLHLHDRSLFDDVNARHRAWGGSLDWSGQPGPRTRLSTLVAWGWEELAEPETDFEYPGKRTWTDEEHRGRLRAMVEQGFGTDHRLRMGLDAGLVLGRTHGELVDTRGLPAWVTMPNADLVQPLLAIDEARNHAELDIFAEIDLLGLGGVVDLRGGLRATVLDATLTPRVSPRLAVTVPLASRTVLRGSVGLVHQARTDPLIVSPSLGTPGLLPERALVALVGAGQDLGPAGVVELLGWVRAMDHLVVGSDDTSGRPRFTNDGTGVAGGGDISWRWAMGRFEADAAYSLLLTRRWNPRHVGFPEAVSPRGDQRHDVTLGGRVFLGKRRGFIVGLGWTSRSGWPTSSLEPVQTGEQQWEWELVGLNDRRLPAIHRLDLRLEHRIPTRRVRIRVSFELNADLGGRVFLENCRSEAPAGETPTCEALTFWPPIRPWLGLKMEW
jgi:hypothetical protein